MINYIRTRSTCKIGVRYHTCIQVFHTLNGNAPGYSNDLFQFALNSHYSLRSAKNKSLRQLKPIAECYRTCFMYNGCKLWNSLPVSIRDATSTSVFLTKGCNYFYFMKHMSCCFYTIRTCKCRVYVYVILFVDHSYCYFFLYAYITSLYRYTPVINSCVRVYFCYGFYSLLFWIHQLSMIIIYHITKIILVVVKFILLFIFSNHFFTN